MTSKSTKRALITSVLAILMCVAMLIGTTFAWFTDTASTGVNKIQAGNLDVQLLDATTGDSIEGETLQFKKAAGATQGEQVLWEPGCTYELPAFKVKNNGSLLSVGMMFGSIAGALVSLLQNFANPDALKLFIVWTLGSLSSVSWSDMQLLAPILLIGTFFVLLALKPLNGLLLGEDYARGLGIHVSRTRLYIVLATGLLAGGVTAFCGPIAFIGVAVPHIARGLFRSSNHRITMPASVLIGACLLLICDVLCSLFTYPLPISTMSALFGAPVIIYIILKN